MWSSEFLRFLWQKAKPGGSDWAVGEVFPPWSASKISFTRWHENVHLGSSLPCPGAWGKRFAEDPLSSPDSGARISPWWKRLKGFCCLSPAMASCPREPLPRQQALLLPPGSPTPVTPAYSRLTYQDTYIQGTSSLF